MTDTEPRNTANVPGSGNSDWGHPGRQAGSHQGSADPADDLTANTADASESVDDGGDDAGDDGPLPGDGVPGDGSVGRHPPSPDVDVVVTSAEGRDADAARADTSDSTPTPTETPAG